MISSSFSLVLTGWWLALGHLAIAVPAGYARR
jgi:uncharacterized membrane protein YccF (DUF307 family)